MRYDHYNVLEKNHNLLLLPVISERLFHQVLTLGLALGTKQSTFQCAL